MTANIVEHAPAKLNLALHVTGRRDDGYHLIDSLVVFTDTGDRLAVEPAESDGFAVTGPFAEVLRNEAANLVERARDLLRHAAGHGSPVAISLEKNLPVASGVGGGSSDAAAALRALVRLWRLSLSEDALAGIALPLGADLPMCLAARPLIARGIGEVIEDAPRLPPLSVVLVNPGTAVATPAVFRALASRRNPPLPALPRPPTFAALVEWLGTTRNDLEPAALSLAPTIGDALASLRAGGAAFARMSGSGATCFGLFASDAQAQRAAAALAAAAPSWYVRATKTIERAEADAAH